MRRAHAPLLASLLFAAACGEKPAPAPDGAAALAPAELPSEISQAPGMKERGPAVPLQQALPVSGAAATLPKNPFTILASPADLQAHWKLAGGQGAPPAADFAREAVIAIRLPATAEPTEMAPLVYSIQKGTHVVLREGTPRELGGEPTDRIHYYRIPTEAGKVASVRYPGA